MTNTIDTIKRLKGQFNSGWPLTPFGEESKTVIEHLLDIIKQQHEALDSARLGGCFKHPQISDGIASALELSAPYAELAGS